MFYVYVLQSLKDKQFYVGYTNNLENAKKYFKLLKKRVPPEALFLKKHFEILERIYPDKFKSALAVKLLQES